MKKIIIAVIVVMFAFSCSRKTEVFGKTENGRSGDYFAKESEYELLSQDLPVSWEGLIEMIRKYIDNDKIISELGEKYQVQMAFWAIFNARFKNDSDFYNLPFEYNDSVIRIARNYQNGQKRIEDPILALFHKELITYKPNYYVTANGNIGRETNSIGNYDMFLIQGCSYLKGRSVSDSNLTPLALEAVTHYANIPIVSYFFALPYLTNNFSASPDEINHMEISLYTGTECILLEMFSELGYDGSLITDESIIQKIRSFFE